MAAQDEPRFRVQLPADTVLMGHPLEVSFVLEYDQGRNFSPPDFEGFRLLSGPNVSSSISMMGGQVSQQATYSYVLQPTAPGEHWIAPATIETSEAVLETKPVAVQVRPNPDGIPPPRREAERTPFPRFFQDDWMPIPRDTILPKPKRKIYRL